MAGEISALPGNPEISRSLTPDPVAQHVGEEFQMEPEPLPATVNSLVSASFQFLTGDV